MPPFYPRPPRHLRGALHLHPRSRPPLPSPPAATTHLASLSAYSLAPSASWHHLGTLPAPAPRLPSRADVLAWVEASHGWFAAAGVEPPLPSVDESMRHRLTGARTSVVRRKQRRDPIPTEAETWLGQVPTEESVASDDTESCHSCDGRM